MREPFAFTLTMPPLVGGFASYTLTIDKDMSFDWTNTLFFTDDGSIPGFLISCNYAKSGRTIWQPSNISTIAGTAQWPFIVEPPIHLEPTETIVFTLTGESVAPSGWQVGDAIVLSFGFDNTKPLAPGEILDFQFFPHSITNLTTLTGFDTGATFTTINVYSGSNVMGGNPALSFPPYISSESMTEGWFVTDDDAFQFELTDMPDGQYDIIFAGSRDVTDNERNGEVTLTTGVTSGPTTQTFDAANPPSGTEAPHVTFTDVEPVAGVIALECSGFGAFNRCYLSALAIVKKGSNITTYLTLMGVTND